jgi:carboxyl-terminal processing protease
VPDVLFPSAIDPKDWGESQQDNALPWDSVARANYATFGDTQNVATQLSTLHDERVAKDKEFAYIFEDIAQYKLKKEDKTISLVDSARLKDNLEQDEKRLLRANERLQRQGLPAVAKLDDLPEDQDPIDPFLDEAASITYDLLATGKYAINSK